jgi:hypothetical protein
MIQRMTHAIHHRSETNDDQMKTIRKMVFSFRKECDALMHASKSKAHTLVELRRDAKVRIIPLLNEARSTRKQAQTLTLSLSPSPSCHKCVSLHNCLFDAGAHDEPQADAQHAQRRVRAAEGMQ